MVLFGVEGAHRQKSLNGVLERESVDKAEIFTIKGVQKRRLAKRVLVFCGRVALVVTKLGSTNQAFVGINFIGL